MIQGASMKKEILVTVKNKIGILADISKILSEQGINIEAVAGYALDGDARIMLVTDDNVRAKDVLGKKGYGSIKENSVVVAVLENKPGALKDLTAKLVAEKIDIKYTYGTVCPTGCPATIALSTNNDEKVLAALKK